MWKGREGIEGKEGAPFFLVGGVFYFLFLGERQGEEKEKGKKKLGAKSLPKILWYNVPESSKGFKKTKTYCNKQAAHKFSSKEKKEKINLETLN